MYNVTASYKTAVNQLAKAFKGYIRVLDTTPYNITGYDDLMKITIKANGQKDGSFIGNAISKYAEVEILNLNNTKYNLEGKEIEIYLGLAIDYKNPDTGFEYVPQGRFIITKQTKDTVKNIIKLECSDYMVKANVKFVDNITYPTTLSAIATSVATSLGLTLQSTTFFNSTLAITDKPNIDIEQTTYREILGWIAECSLGNAMITRDNKVLIKNFPTTAETINASTISEVKVYDKFGNVNSVTLERQPISDIVFYPSSRPTTPINVAIVNNPFLDSQREATIQALYTNLNGFNYIPYDIKAYGYYYLDLMDKIAINDGQGNTFTTYYMNYEITFDGSSEENSSAVAYTQKENQTSIGTTIKDRMKFTEAKVDKVNQEIELIVGDIDALEGKYTSIKQTVDGIDLSVYYTKTETNNNITNAVDGIGVGGTNILKNTSKPIDSTDLVYTQTIYNDAIKGNVFEKATTGTTEVFFGSSRTGVVDVNTKYTISFDVWVNDYVSSIDVFWLSDTQEKPKTGTGLVNVTTIKSTLVPTRNTWQRYSYTFTTKPDDYTGYIRIDNNGSITSGQNAIMRITNVKLEKGSKATDWSPSPLEMATTVAMNSALSLKADGITLGSYYTKTETDNKITPISNQLSDISNDNKLTPSEKQDVKRDYDSIVAEKTTLEAQATTYGITTEKTAYTTAYTNLVNYISPFLTNLTTTEDITGATFRTKFIDYNTAKATLVKAITDTARSLVSTAQTTADNSKSASDTANALLSDMANDNKFTPLEKQSVKLEWDTIVSEKANIDAQADVYAITTEKTAYGTAYTTLSTYITPLLANLTTTDTIVGTTFRANFKAYYDARTLLLKKVAESTKTFTSSSIANIEVGAENMITNSSFTSPRNWTGVVVPQTGVDYRTIEEDVFNGYNALVICNTTATVDTWYGTQGIISVDDGTLFVNQEYTISGWCYIDSSVTRTSDITLEIKGLRASDNASVGWASIPLHTYIPTGQSSTPLDTWFYFEKTFKHTDFDWKTTYIFPWVKQKGKFKLAQLNFEKGNKASAWHPSSVDLYTVEQTLSTNEINVAISTTASGIETTFQQTYYTKTDVDSTVKGMNDKYGEIDKKTSTLVGANGFSVKVMEAIEEQGIKSVKTGSYLFDQDGFHIGELTDEFNATLNTTGLTFNNGSNAIASYTNSGAWIEQLESDKITVSESIKVGSFEIREESGKLGFYFVG